MSIPRPKILTRVTIPAGGWTFDFDVTAAVAYDTQVVATLTAGDYYMSGDNQADDLLQELQDVATTAVQALGGWAASSVVLAAIDPDTHKVLLKFDGFAGANAGVRIDWPNCTAGLASALGFDNTGTDADATENPKFTADRHHAWGWYADEDGLLSELSVVDIPMSQAAQAKSISGRVVTQQLAETFAATLKLQWISASSMFSDGASYGDTPIYPYAWNAGLEYWWRAAAQGVEFRVYEDAYIATSRAGVSGTSTAANATTLTDSTRNWSAPPYEHKGMILYEATFANTTPQIHQAWYITTNTATVLTINAHPSGYFPDKDTTTYYVFAHPYRTYVLDMEKMQRFDYRQSSRGLERYDIEIPLLRYVA